MASNGGNDCSFDDGTKKEESCDMGACPVDCKLSKWYKTTADCPKQCGLSSSTITADRSVVTIPVGTGKKCDSLTKTITCPATKDCPVDCPTINIPTNAFILNNLNTTYRGEIKLPSYGNSVYNRYSYKVPINELKPATKYVFKPITFTQISCSEQMINNIKLEFFYREFEIKYHNEWGHYKNKIFETKKPVTINNNPFISDCIEFTTTDQVNNKRPTINQNGEFTSTGRIVEIGIKVIDSGLYLKQGQEWEEESHKIEIMTNFNSISEIFTESSSYQNYSTCKLNLPEFNINCQVSEWDIPDSKWNELTCPTECGKEASTLTRNRTVKVSQVGDGEACPNLTETKQCSATGQCWSKKNLPPVGDIEEIIILKVVYIQ